MKEALYGHGIIVKTENTCSLGGIPPIPPFPEEDEGEPECSGKIEIEVRSIVFKGQQTILFLTERLGPAQDRRPRSYDFEGPDLANDGDKVTFKVSDVVTSKYIVRISVDGAESIPDVDDSNEPDSYEYTGPEVEIKCTP